MAMWYHTPVVIAVAPLTKCWELGRSKKYSFPSDQMPTSWLRLPFG